jgi:hypothetical protein
MQTGLHAVGWGLQRLGILLGAALILTLLALTVIVTVVVIGQAAATFGQ